MLIYFATIDVGIVLWRNLSMSCDCI